MYRVVQGTREDVFPYVQQPTFGHQLIILAQYCVAKESDSRIGNTEREILKGIKDNWIDLVQLSSKTTNHAVIDQDMLHKISGEKDLVVDYISR